MTIYLTSYLTPKSLRGTTISQICEKMTFSKQFSNAIPKRGFKALCMDNIHMAGNQKSTFDV
jgi:hypothetical protein